VLRNIAGEAFMTHVHPLADLAPRDVVARAIAAEMLATRAPVVLDATGVDDLERRFPTVTAACTAAGFDWTRTPVPVAPAAHYWMGGVATDPDGRTSLPGLFAVGEVACTGVHGANRLASNSLLEGLVFAHRAAVAVRVMLWTADPSTYAGSSMTGDGRVEPGPGLAPDARPDPVPSDPTVSEPTRADLQDLLWQNAGLLRDSPGLRQAHATLFRWHLNVSGSTDRERLETANLLHLARAVVASALAREESRGAHARTDHPETSPGVAEHLAVTMSADGTLGLTRHTTVADLATRRRGASAPTTGTRASSSRPVPPGNSRQRAVWDGSADDGPPEGSATTTTTARPEKPALRAKTPLRATPALPEKAEVSP
jgi:L-aspartate oxidase